MQQTVGLWVRGDLLSSGAGIPDRLFVVAYTRGVNIKMQAFRMVVSMLVLDGKPAQCANTRSQLHDNFLPIHTLLPSSASPRAQCIELSIANKYEFQ
jgi:hypothetical protein